MVEILPSDSSVTEIMSTLILVLVIEVVFDSLEATVLNQLTRHCSLDGKSR